MMPLGRHYGRAAFIGRRQHDDFSKGSIFAALRVMSPLSDREREILRLVVQSFVQTAGPVGSRFLARHSSLGLSAASIRNTMSDLEEGGYLEHPYTSAGRIPTDLGYRTFVEELMGSKELSPREKRTLREELERIVGDAERLFDESSRVLASLSNLLGVVLTPKLSSGVLERIEIVPLSSERVLFVISVASGLVRTIVIRAELEVDRAHLERIVATLNERLAGLTMEEIRATGADRVSDIADVTGIVQLTLKESGQLFGDAADANRLRVGGTQNLLAQPEFREPDDLRALIELIEDRDSVVSLVEDENLDALTGVGEVSVRIGTEHRTETSAARYSIITARYQLGNNVGTIGVIGPTRMDYGHVVSVVEGMAAILNESL